MITRSEDDVSDFYGLRVIEPEGTSVSDEYIGVRVGPVTLTSSINNLCILKKGVFFYTRPYL